MAIKISKHRMNGKWSLLKRQILGDGVCDKGKYEMR